MLHQRTCAAYVVGYSVGVIAIQDQCAVIGYSACAQITGGAPVTHLQRACRNRGDAAVAVIACQHRGARALLGDATAALDIAREILVRAVPKAQGVRPQFNEAACHARQGAHLAVAIGGTDVQRRTSARERHAARAGQGARTAERQRAIGHRGASGVAVHAREGLQPRALLDQATRALNVAGKALARGIAKSEAACAQFHRGSRQAGQRGHGAVTIGTAHVQLGPRVAQIQPTTAQAARAAQGQGAVLDGSRAGRRIGTAQGEGVAVLLHELTAAAQGVAHREVVAACDH